MATLTDMVDEVKSKLAGYTLRQDRVTYTLNAVGLTDTSIQIGSSNNLAKGIIEIDNELIWIDSYNKASNTLNVIPGFGRGYQNTDAATHTQYSQVTLAPAFPRVMIKQAINDTINSVFPSLWSMASTTFTFNPAQNSYGLPTACEDVMQVSWETIGPTKEWAMVNRWRLDQMANATSFGSNAAIVIGDSITPGRTVQVWYRKTPTALTNDTDVFTTVTGLEESSRDVIILGACARLLAFVDSGRLNLTSAQADQADTKIPSSAGASISKYVYALFQQRLKEESGRLNGKYPIRPHYTR